MCDVIFVLFRRISEVVDAFERLVLDNFNGAVMSVTPYGKQYKFPKRLAAVKL